jgi:5-methylthioadenosine/S-adenosylhomocysteine deaminase
MSIELIVPEWIVPVEPAGTVLTGHALAFDGQTIVAITPCEQAFVRWPLARRHERPGHLLIPGLVNLHTHAAMSLLRGTGDDLPLERWLRERIWPLEQALLSAEFVFDGAVLAIHEMLRGGITCFNDMYFFPEQTARAARALSMRAHVGIVVVEFPTVYGSGAADYLRKGLALRDALRDDPLVRCTLAPHAPYTVGDDSFRRVAQLSAELGMPMSCHLHETRFEIEQSLREHGRRPLARLADLGLATPELIAVHAVHLDAQDLAVLAASGASVAHCPHSNLKLGSGVAPISELLARGVNVGLGTDGSASNNRLDLIAEMRTAALLAKVQAGDAAAWPAGQVLQAATLGGARALGLGDRIGSLVPGKLADLVAIDLSGADVSPVFDPVSQLVYSAGRDLVSDVWVDGRHVVHKRQLLGQSGALLVSEVVARSRVWQNRISEILS